VAEQGDDRRGKSDQREENRQQGNPEHQGQRQSDLAGPPGFDFRQARNNDRDEDDVVDAEHNLQHRERHERGNDGRIGDPVKEGHR